NCRLANCHKRRYTFRKVHIEPRAKTDHAEALARTYRLAGADETHDATGNKAGNLHNGNARARDRDDERIALVVDTGFVHVRIKELPRLVEDFLDFSSDRAPVYVAIENAHEYRNSRQGFFAKAEFTRRCRARHLAYATICRRHYQTVAYRCDARWVSEKISAPDGGK